MYTLKNENSDKYKRSTYNFRKHRIVKILTTYSDPSKWINLMCWVYLAFNYRHIIYLHSININRCSNNLILSPLSFKNLGKASYRSRRSKARIIYILGSHYNEHYVYLGYRLHSGSTFPSCYSFVMVVNIVLGLQRLFALWQRDILMLVL